jgi:hypothetical protein
LTMKNKTIRSLAMMSLFSGCIMSFSGLFMLISYFCHSSLTVYIAFPATLLTWILSIMKYKYSTTIII